MMNGTLFSPVSQSDRIVSIDLLRGVAVLGILIMNIQSFSMPSAAYINPTAYGDLSGINRWVWILSHILASGKFMGLFSILFGAGVLLFTSRADLKGLNSAVLHYRRMAWLLIFGLMHAYLLWMGDILVSYSLCGMLVFLFRKKRPQVLLRIAFVFFIIPLLLDSLFAFSMSYWPEESVRSIMENWNPGIEIIQHQLDIYRSAWLTQMELRIPQAIFMQTGLFFMGIFWRVMALMLLGMALFKWEVLSCGRSSRFYTKMAVTGLIVGYLLSGAGVFLNFTYQWTLEFSLFLGAQFNYVGSVAVALGYIGVVMLISKSASYTGLNKAFSAVGRMAFTNYILMTLIGTLIFYGHGLGLYGSVERKFQIVLVLAIWILILIISPLWLRRFRFGPLERLWRTLTYWSW
jgi:uncharacterized protein